MRKFLLISFAIAAALLSAGIASLVTLLRGGGVASLLLIPGALVLGLGFFVSLGLQGSRGGLAAFLRGQSASGLPDIPRLLHGNQVTTQDARLAELHLHPGGPVAQVSDRFLSVAVDLSQVTGGKWWDPAADHIEMSSGSLTSPLFDFDRPQLDRLTAALAPLYLRIGGSESDKIYYSLDDDPALPPAYHSTLTRSQWDRIQAFCARNDCELVFTLNVGPATRRLDGSWDSANIEALMRYAAEAGQRVAVWELGNEVNVFFFVHGLRQQISVEQYVQALRDLKALRDRYFPASKLAGQGSAFWPVLGEPLGFFFGFSAGLMRAAPGLLDLFTWHYYPQQSRRCPMASRRAHPARLLDPSNLDELRHWAALINALRDQHAPGLPIWLAETGNAQCGGAPGLSETYLAGLWWLDELGSVARLGQPVVVRQSLTGMNYGLLDEATLTPRPDYWNSLLWRRLMGREVYALRVEGPSTLRAYAHSRPDGKGIALLAINLDMTHPARLWLPAFESQATTRYLFTAPDLLGGELLLNGSPLHLGSGGEIPELPGQQIAPGEDLVLPPLSYGFFVFES